MLKPYQTAIDKLILFKSLIIEYDGLARLSHPTTQDHARMVDLRTELNSSLHEAARLVRKSGMSTSIFYSPPPIVGGMSCDLDLFANLFTLPNFQLSPIMVVDLIDRAVGNYVDMRKTFFLRLINPLYWIGEIIRIPFRLLSFSGFNGLKAEHSTIGRIYKLVASFATFVWTVIQILDFFGINVKQVLSKLAGG